MSDPTEPAAKSPEPASKPTETAAAPAAAATAGTARTSSVLSSALVVIGLACGHLFRQLFGDGE